MRCIGLILRLIPFAWLAVSCAVPRTISRTAKVEHLVPDMVVVPVVTELDVCPYPYVEDTVFVRRLFDISVPYLTHKEMEAVLTESLMKRTGADMLVEPQLTSKTSYRGVGNTVAMSLQAYPARYKTFRTMTEDDARMLNSLNKKEQVGNIRLPRLLGGDAAQSVAVAEDLEIASDDVGKVSEIKKSVAPKKEGSKVKVPGLLAPRYSRPVKYRGIYEVGAGGPVSDHAYFNNGQIWVNTSQGVNFTPCLFLGGGCGFAWHGRHTGGGSDYEEGYRNYYLIPVYGHMRMHFLDYRISPYFDLRLGVAGVVAGGLKDADRHSNPFWYGIDPFISSGIGFSFGCFSIGAEYSVGFDDFLFSEWSDICVRLGFTF